VPYPCVSVLHVPLYGDWIQMSGLVNRGMHDLHAIGYGCFVNLLSYIYVVDCLSVPIMHARCSWFCLGGTLFTLYTRIVSISFYAKKTNNGNVGHGPTTSLPPSPPPNFVAVSLHLLPANGNAV
jgi:hypothetical protein